jgi:hypothetical protein
MALRQDIVYYVAVNIRETIVPALVFVRELGMIHAEQL